MLTVCVRCDGIILVNNMAIPSGVFCFVSEPNPLLSETRIGDPFETWGTGATKGPRTAQERSMYLAMESKSLAHAPESRSGPRLKGGLVAFCLTRFQIIKLTFLFAIYFWVVLAGCNEAWSKLSMFLDE
jgi:hypothetical protein